MWGSAQVQVTLPNLAWRPRAGGSRGGYERRGQNISQHTFIPRREHQRHLFDANSCPEKMTMILMIQ
jgi:hypothetical protein